MKSHDFYFGYAIGFARAGSAAVNAVIAFLLVTLIAVCVAMALHIHRQDHEVAVLHETLRFSMGLTDRATDELQHQTEVVEQAEALLIGLQRDVVRGKIERRILLVAASHRNAKTRAAVTADATRISAAVMAASQRYGLDPATLAAQIEQESAYDALATGAEGERGLMQLLESTASGLDVEWGRAYDIETNIDAGARYLAYHLSAAGRRYDVALMRYNGGGDPAYTDHVRRRKLKILKG